MRSTAAEWSLDSPTFQPPEHGGELVAHLALLGDAPVADLDAKRFLDGRWETEDRPGLAPSWPTPVNGPLDRINSILAPRR
jgi:hypothetical protein